MLLFFFKQKTAYEISACLDLINSKLERQVRKYKTRVNRKNRDRGYEEGSFVETVPNVSENEEDTSESDIEIIRSKTFSLKPMDSEEAVLQMNLLGHDFFVFNDRETDGTSIVYRRKDGKYGLIETE